MLKKYHLSARNSTKENKTQKEKKIQEKQIRIIVNFRKKHYICITNSQPFYYGTIQTDRTTILDRQSQACNQPRNNQFSPRKTSADLCKQSQLSPDRQ